MRVLVTGGAGFIGSALVMALLREGAQAVVNVDKLTYAGSALSLAEAERFPEYVFAQADIADREAMMALFACHRPQMVIHLAAESHVDRSIARPDAFVRTNVVGTFTLLEVVREFWQSLPAAQQAAFRFLHVSTDEVYGDLAAGQAPCSEAASFAPSSPYSASKAGADHLVQAWHRTYGLPTLTVRCSNNYGPRQHPEKLIPRMICRALAGESLPVFGDGRQIRDWLYVEDHVRGLLAVSQRGQVGGCYNLAGGNELENCQVVAGLCELLESLAVSNPLARRAGGPGFTSLIRHVADRAGHDRRYALDAGLAWQELGWRPLVSFGEGLKKTVSWYLDNAQWCRQHTAADD